jgi:hypothetical protein
MTCFIRFVRLSFPHWLWRQVVPYTLFRLRAHGGCDRSAEDAFSSATPDPTFAFVGGPCCPTLDFVIAFWIMITFYTLLTSLICIMSFETILNFLSMWCELIVFYLTDNPVCLISTKGARWVWPISRRCLFLLDNSSYLRICGGPCCPTFDFVFVFWIRIAFDTLLTSL